MVLALQSATGFSGPLAEVSVPAIVALAITRELAPVLAGLMVAARVGAAIAAELGTMRVSEQIDALVTMQAEPIKYLVVPRVIAGTIALPLLVLVGDVLGILGGYIVGVFQLNFQETGYLIRTYSALNATGVVSGLIKAAVFGFLITILGCYNGTNCRGGAQGVGRATTNAVVSASILILIANYAITLITVTFFDNGLA